MRLQTLSLFAPLLLGSAFGPAQQSSLPEVPLDPARAAALEAYEASGEEERFVPQEDHPANLRGPAVPYGLGLCDDVLVGVGPRYTVRFDGAGFEMRQRGGRQNGAHALTFTLEDIRRGSDLLYSSEDGVGRPEQDGFVASVELTRMIDARFEVGAAGIEQSFLFHELPGCDGDLVVRGRLETNLARVETQDGPTGLAFDSLPVEGERSRFRYGGVTGIDAAGRRVSGSLTLQGEELELRLPADFMRNAEAPILLDPVIGPMDQTLPTFSYYEPEKPAVAFDHTNQRYLAVWTERGYGGQRDIYGQFRSTSGAPIGGLLPLVFNDFSPQSPELANINATNKFLLVYRDGPIYARTVDAGSGAVSSRAYIWSANDSTTFDVGGEVLPPFENALVAITDIHQHTVHAVLVRCPASGGTPTVGSSSKMLTPLNASPHTRVSVSHSGGTRGVWIVGWRQYRYPQYEIRGVLVNYALDASIPTTLINSGNHIDYPSVTGDGLYFAAAGVDSGGVRARSFYGSFSTGSSVIATAGMRTVSSGDFEVDEIELERVGDYNVIAWQSRVPVPGPDISRIVGRKLWLTTSNPAESVYTMSQNSGTELHDHLRLFSEKSASTLTAPHPDRAMLITSTYLYFSTPGGVYATVISD